MSEENRLDLAVTIHFTVPNHMQPSEAHMLMLERVRGWLHDPDNDMRSSWGLFSRNCEPDTEPCVAVLSGTVSTNHFPYGDDRQVEGEKADKRTGLSREEEVVWGDLSVTGGRSAPDVAGGLTYPLEDVLAILRRLEARGMATLDVMGLWWRTYL